jgi:hypothetical protein
MDETIEKAVKAVMDMISGYPFPDQAYMLTELAEKLREESHECLAIEYGLTDNDEL